MIKRGFFYFNTTKIIVINFIFYLIAIVLLLLIPDFFFYIAITPEYILQGKYLWTIITSMFMHDPTSPFHLFANMISLFFLGGFLERLIGKKRFLFIYFASGIIASLSYVFITYLFHGDLTIPAVGASGAIFGVAGMLAVLTPKMPVYILFIPVALPMWLGVILILVLLWIISIAAGLNIGNVAHLGGLIVGVLYAFYLKQKYKRKARIIANFFR